MGGDGQALSNKRRILEKSKVFVTAEELRKEEGKSDDITLTDKELYAQRWAHCALSLEPLEIPVVFDLCGRLYSKKSVLDELLQRKHRLNVTTTTKTTEKKLKEITIISRLSDVREIVNVDEGEKVKIRCPLTGFEASYGIHKFVGYWGCGHVLSTFSSSSLSQFSFEGLKKLNDTKNSNLTVENTIEACPFCGEKSFPVSLILDNEDDEMTQFKRLRPLQRIFSKRKRSDD